MMNASSACLPEFSCDWNNYAKKPSHVYSMSFSIETTHPVANNALKLGTFSVVRLMIPGCRADVSKTMAETFMNNSKSYKGATYVAISGITQKPCWLPEIDDENTYAVSISDDSVVISRYQAIITKCT